MAKLSRKTRTQVPEAEVQKIITKGGSSIKKTTPTNDEVKSVQLRLYLDQISAIDAVRALRTGSQKVSRHAWIVEAIQEKIERDGQ